MNVETGEVVSEEERNGMLVDVRKKYKRVDIDNLPHDIQEEIEMHPERKRFKRKVGVNEKCPCGSGRKFKKCCMKL